MTRWMVNDCPDCGATMLGFMISNSAMSREQAQRLARSCIALSVAEHLGEISKRDAIRYVLEDARMARVGELKAHPDDKEM